jgi:hypothetical protein
MGHWCASVFHATVYTVAAGYNPTVAESDREAATEAIEEMKIKKR